MNSMEYSNGRSVVLRRLIANPILFFWCIAVLALIVSSLLPQAGLSEVSEGGFGRDKVARLLVFLVLSFCPTAFFPSIKLGLALASSMAPLGFLLEVMQKSIPGRTFSPEDMIANNIGAILGILAALAVRFFFRTGRFGEGLLEGRGRKTEARVEGAGSEKTRREPAKPQRLSDPDSREPMPTSRKFRKSHLWWALGVVLVIGIAAFGRQIYTRYVGANRVMPEQGSAATADSKKSKTVQRKMPAVFSGPVAAPRASRTGGDARFEVSRPEAKPPNGPQGLSPRGGVVPPQAVEKSGVKVGKETDYDATAVPAEDLPEPPPAAEPSDSKKSPPRPDEMASAPAEPEVFSIQVGAFRLKKNADSLVRGLEADGYDARIMHWKDAQDEEWFAVRVGRYRDRVQAEEAAAALRRKEKLPVQVKRVKGYFIINSRE